MNHFIEELFGFIARCCVEIFGYYTARVVLPVVSLGHVYVAPAHPAEVLFAEGTRPYERRQNGTIRINSYVACWIGLLIWALALALFLTVYYP